MGYYIIVGVNRQRFHGIFGTYGYWIGTKSLKLGGLATKFITHVSNLVSLNVGERSWVIVGAVGKSLIVSMEGHE